MHCTAIVPCSLKQTISHQIYYNLSKKWINKSYALQHKVISVHKFEQHRAIHKTVAQFNEVNINETIGQKTDLKHVRDISKTRPSLKDFLLQDSIPISGPVIAPSIPYIKEIDGSNQKVYFEVYGCQMNVSDTEVIWSILKSHGYKETKNLDEANIVLLITCAIRDNAEQRVWNKLEVLNRMKKKKKDSMFPMKIGLLGCMAERLKEKILERGKLVDVIAGPDSYKDLPRLLSVSDKETAINVILSFDETYADVAPIRLNPGSTSAFVSIMRGCDNMCTYCIVPFTRGKERSRPIDSIISEVQSLSDDGVKEVILLGQNVNSYRDLSQTEFYTVNDRDTYLAKGFKTVYKNKKGGLRFSDLLDKVSLVDPEMRIRFTSAHPKDFPDEVLQLIAERPNICNELHIPAQSGNSKVLERMRRGYTRESYIDLVYHVRDILPNVCLSGDFIAGFCGETEEEFQETLSLIELVKYNKLFLFSYSMREKTTAHRRYKDDVEASLKIERLKRMISLFRDETEKLNKSQIGQLQLVLIEGASRRSNEYLQGRNEGGTRVVIPSMAVPREKCFDMTKPITSGDYVVVQISSANSNTLKGVPLYHSSITDFAPSFERRS